MNEKLIIKTCPTCGSDRIQLARKDLSRKYQDQIYLVPEVEYYECPNCGEKVFDTEAMRKIQEKSPAYQRSRTTNRV
jgi:YgiT-type zinc finger domain-containing protein